MMTVTAACCLSSAAQFSEDSIMQRFKRRAFLLVPILLCLIAGCGSKPTVPGPDADQLADAKMEALKRLAKAMAGDANGPEARACLEDFRNVPFDPHANPKQAEDILRVYRKDLQGKYRGEIPQLLQMEMAPLEAATKNAP
jgi:hypothetical protein